MTDLSNHIERQKLVDQIQADIDYFCRAEFAEDPRTHLGASIIGHDCAAYAWNTFRWLKFEQFDGRMLRLFNRGHEEESRFIRWLRGIGFEVRDRDPVTDKQFRITGVKGHFGGSLDSMMKAPARYNIPDELIWLGEFKTHNAKSFAKLKKHGVAMSKPMHFRQCCSYGRAYGFQYALYCAVNKDTDELYFEIVVLDYRQADDLFRKAEGIILAQTRPQKIAQTAAYFECKFCDFSDLCHNGAVPNKNCRSCRLATPVDDGKWHCGHRGQLIPKSVIPAGCDSWARIA
jgi:hypothetical protein